MGQSGWKWTFHVDITQSNQWYIIAGLWRTTVVLPPIMRAGKQTKWGDFSLVRRTCHIRIQQWPHDWIYRPIANRCKHNLLLPLFNSTSSYSDVQMFRRSDVEHLEVLCISIQIASAANCWQIHGRLIRTQHTKRSSLTDYTVI